MEKINKWKAMMITGVVAVVAFLFLPFLSENGYSVSFFDMMEMAGDISGEALLVLVLIVGGSGLAAVGGFLQNKLFGLAGSVAAAVGMAYFLFVADLDLMDYMEAWGFGLWLSIIAVIVEVVLAVQLQKEEK